jgi:hypothetical protein
MKRRIIRLACWLFLLALPLIWVFSHKNWPADLNAVLRPEPVVFPRIVPSESFTGNREVTRTFRFEGKDHSLVFSVDKAVYVGAKSADKSITVRKDLADYNWSAGFQEALMNDASQGAFYSTLLEELRDIRDSEQLDSDRFAELITIFIQSMPYCTAPDQNPKFPIETFVDACGDCDDKSRLLAALLSREDYDVALFLFREEEHMAAGIRVAGAGYKDTEYTFIETTSPSYIGFPSYEYSDTTLNSDPEVIHVGEGRKTYESVSQVNYLHEVLTKQRKLIPVMKERIDEITPVGEQLKAAYDEISRQLDNTRGVLPASEYNAIIDRANQLRQEHNRVIENLNGLIRRLNRASTITNYVSEHPDDRKGVYNWVRETQDQEGVAR